MPTETGESGLVTIPTTEVLAPRHFSIGAYENGEADNEQPELHDIELYRTEFVLGVGLLPNLELSTQLPFVQFERGVAGHRHTDDIGGLRLNLKYRLLNEADGAPMSLALLGAAVIGTGRDASRRSLTATPPLAAARPTKRWASWTRSYGTRATATSPPP
ncbi:MAG: hypothetical protein ACHQ4J_00180 [Candidatus Binatia bacterium]